MRERKSETYYASLDALTAHVYRYDAPTSRPDNPGWNACSCGWEGYWCEFHPHLASVIEKNMERVSA